MRQQSSNKATPKEMQKEEGRMKKRRQKAEERPGRAISSLQPAPDFRLAFWRGLGQFPSRSAAGLSAAGMSC
jgi:hypothetical protein